MTKILFLAFDGVLNCEAHRDDVVTRYGVAGVEEHPHEILNPARCARVQQICDRTGASIVIVSGWRRWVTVEQMTECLRYRGITAPVLGAVAGLRLSGETRALAAREWMDAHACAQHVILDDEDWRWRGWDTLVHVPDGIEDEHVEAAVRVLGEVLPEDHPHAVHARESAAAEVKAVAESVAPCDHFPVEFAAVRERDAFHAALHTMLGEAVRAQEVMRLADAWVDAECKARGLRTTEDMQLRSCVAYMRDSRDKDEAELRAARANEALVRAQPGI